MKVEIVFVSHTENRKFAEALIKSCPIDRIVAFDESGKEVEVASAVIALSANFDEQFEAALK